MEIEKLFLIKYHSEDLKERNRIRTEADKMSDNDFFGGERLLPLLQGEIGLHQVAAARAELLLMKGEIQQGKRKVKRLIVYSLYRFLKQDIEDLYNDVDFFRTKLRDEGYWTPDEPAKNTLRIENKQLSAMFRNLADELAEYGRPDEYFSKKRREEKSDEIEDLKELFFRKN